MAGRLDSAQPRHRYIKNQNIGAEPHGLLERHRSIAGGGDDLELLSEEASFDREELLVVVCKEDTGPTHGFHPIGSGWRAAPTSCVGMFRFHGTGVGVKSRVLATGGG